MQTVFSLSLVAIAAAQTSCDDATGVKTPVENLAHGFGNMPPIEGDVDIGSLLADPVFGPWAMGNMGCLGCAGGAAGLARRLKDRRLEAFVRILEGEETTETPAEETPAEDAPATMSEAEEMAMGLAVLACAGVAPLDSAGMAALTEPACDDTQFGAIAAMSAGGRRLQMDALNDMFTTVLTLGNECSSCYFGFAGAAASGSQEATMGAANACFGAANTAIMFAAPVVEEPVVEEPVVEEPVVEEPVVEEVEGTSDEILDEILDELDQIEEDIQNEGDGDGAAPLYVYTAVFAALFSVFAW